MTATARIDEHEVFGKLIGERVSVGKLNEIALETGIGDGSYSDSREYVVSCFDKGEYQKRFKLPRSLSEKRKSLGISFRVYIYVREDIITGGHISKRMLTASEAPIETDATQQELRAVSRILTYLLLEV